MRFIGLGVLTAIVFSGCSAISKREVASTAACDDSQFLYKYCTNQKEAFESAILQSKSDGKPLLITFGADWCPWCRSMHGTLRSQEVLSQLKGQIRLIEIGMNIGKTREKNEPGLEVLRSLIAKSGQKITVDGIPFLVMIDAKSEKIIFLKTKEVSTDNFGQDRNKLVLILNEAIQTLK